MWWICFWIYILFCFIVCRGFVYEIRSGNGVSFIGVVREFGEVIEEMDYDKIIEKLCK